MEVTKANLATYLAGLTPSATPYPIEITETVASDWSNILSVSPIGVIINTNTPSGVYLDLGLTVIPASATTMNRTFYGCISLTTAPAIPSSVTDMSYAFYFCISLTTAPIIPSSVTNMNSTFDNCTSLTTVPIIPSSVTTINSSFLSCILLHTIQNFAVDVDNCDMTNAFQNCPALANIYVTTLSESSWHLLHTDTGATGTDYTIYNPDGTVAGSGTVAGTSQVLTLYGKSDELVISANITPTLAEETATSQVQWHKSGLPYDDELMIFNAKNPKTVISNLLITTIRKNANFTLGTYVDGQKIRIANTHATNTITCTLPTGQTMNGQSSFTIAPDTLLEFELIGTSWKCVSNEWELIGFYSSISTPIPMAQYREVKIELIRGTLSVLATSTSRIDSIIAQTSERRFYVSFNLGDNVNIIIVYIVFDVNKNVTILAVVKDGVSYVFGGLYLYGKK